MVKPRESSEIQDGKTYKMETGCGHLYVTVTKDDQGLASVFSHHGKSGGCASAQSEAICRLVSVCLRSGIEISEVVKQLKDIKCASPILTKDGTIHSCADALAKVLSLYIDTPKPL